MTDDRTLRLVQDASDSDGSDAPDGVVDVESVLRSADVADYDRVYRRIATAELDRVAGIPLYDFAWIRLGFAFAQNALPPMAITHLVVLYRALDDVVTERGVTAIECGDLQANYQAVAVDLADARGLEIRGVDDGKRPSAWRGLLAGFWGILLVVADQAFSLIWRRLRGPVDPAETVFVPLVNRFDSMRPVMDAYEGDYRTVLPSATLAWLRDVRHRVPELAEYDPIPVSYFVSLGVLAREAVGLARLAYALGVRDEFSEQLRAFVRREFDVPFDETLAFVVANLYRVHLPAVPNLFAAERLLDEVGPSNVVVGSLGSRQQAILDAAKRRGCRTYHVPHSATTGYELIPHPPTVHFVPGQVAVDHLERSEQADDLSNLVPLGRAQLAALYRERPSELDHPGNPLRVVVATQPFEDQIRRAFVTDVLDALEEYAGDVEVVVKLHPNESPSFYDDLLADRPNVTVATADLHDHLRGADLAVTVNSNVGLEAMVLGTPAVCVNEWFPMVRTRPYALAGPVPTFESRAALADYVRELDAELLVELREEQHAYLREQYELDGDPAAAIAEFVASGKTAADYAG